MDEPLLLLVEPDAALRRAIAEVLGATGHRVLGVALPEAALSDAVESPQVLALSFLSGAEGALAILGAWRADASRASVPLLAITATEDAHAAEAAFAAGADDVMPWPADASVAVWRVR